MRHRVAGRKLGRTTAHRVALLRNLSTALFDKERIRTTLTKAKELRPFAERLVTLAKRETLHARRQVLRHIHNRVVVAKLFDSLSARYAQRPGGYTRIIKLGPRRGDNAEMAIIELVGSEESVAEAATEPKAEGKPSRKGKAKAKAAPEAEAAEPEPKKKKKKKKKTASKAKASKKRAATGRGATKRKTTKRAKTAKKAASKRQKRGAGD